MRLAKVGRLQRAEKVGIEKWNVCMYSGKRAKAREEERGESGAE